MLRSASADSICREIYRHSRSFYNQISRRSGGRDDGYQILYGSPYLEAPILFIGYQPGRGCKTVQEEREYGSEDRWPARSEYVTECWDLARWLRWMFGGRDLLGCVGMNAIFVRSDTISHYRRNYPEDVRQDVQEFCLPRVKRIVEAVRPKTIVTIGMETLNLFGGGEPVLRNDRDRVLARAGQIAGCEAIGVLHLSGARISTLDRQAVARYIRDSIWR